MDREYFLLIFFSSLIILSYVFNLIAQKIKVPSVLLLLATGISIRLLIPDIGDAIQNLGTVLSLVGTLGLILIVLEGSLDLEFSKQKLPLIGSSFFAAIIILLLTNFLVATVIYKLVPGISFKASFVNAIPLSIISSAIAIPSVEQIGKNKREFIVYESIFSDVFGILIFNFVVFTENIAPSSFGFLFVDLAIVALIGFIFTALLLYFISKNQLKIRFFILIAVLILLYTSGKVLHFSSLLIIFIFGIILNNTQYIPIRWITKFIRIEVLRENIEQFKMITVESAFLIRTIFFFIFGYSLLITNLFDQTLILTGSLILFILYGIRFLYLRFLVRANLFPELFIAPRGLITIILYYSIPDEYSIGLISEGLLFYIILMSSLIMMVGLMLKSETEVDSHVFMGRKEMEFGENIDIDKLEKD
ncbi:MAG: cation:proton antiporter [Bacteroidota bacterium]|jgi:Kef-type K+ transport system membrane component KefB